MGDKTKTVATPSKTTGLLDRASPTGLQSSRKMSAPVGLQQSIGNQAMLQLFEAGVLQAKLRVSQPGDADEVEADRVAEQIVSRHHAPVLQRKCSCDGGGTPCSKCAGEEEEKIHRSVAGPILRSPESLIQRSPVDSSAASSQAAPTKTETPAKPTKPPTQVIVDDEAKTVAPHQMRKTQFIAVLRAEACTAADAILASVKHTTRSCPYIEKWLGFYEKQSSQHIEQALHKYAPETAAARNAHEAIRLAVKRVQRATLTWAKTGKVEGIPKELAGKEQAHDTSPGSSTSSGGILGFFSGQKKKDDSSTAVLRKARNGEHTPAQDAASVRSQLGSGHSLDSRVQSQMSAAFGQDFSGVRVHTDSRAASLSSDLQARAFTVGSDVAFASGEYRPGTPIGDTLIAHELAHVVQQAGATSPGIPQRKAAEGDYAAMEKEADASAIAAAAQVWSGGYQAATFGAKSRLRSTLRLQRCAGDPDKVVLKDMSPKQRKQFAKAFVERHFEVKDRDAAQKILDDMLQSGEVSFKDEETLKTEIFKRIETTKFMQQSQALFGKAFEYPNHPKAKACLPNNKDGLSNPRVNKAAEPYWGPVQEAQGLYHWDLSEAGKKDAYKALTTLFTQQKSICDMTLIHCDYLASVIHFRAFAESIGVEEFNKRVKNGDIEMRLAWNGFQELEDIGWSHSKKSISLREVRPANENDLVVGDHVIFWNHRAYNALNKGIGNAWKLENAILVYRRDNQDHFLGHGSGDQTNQSMRERLAREYNVVVKKAKDLITGTESKNAATASDALAKMGVQFPNVKKEAGDWVIKTDDKTFRLRSITWNDPDLTGLRSPDDPSKMNCVKRPAEAPGDSC